MNAKRITVFVLCVIVSIGMLRAATNNENKEKDTDRTGWTVTASNYKYDFKILLKLSMVISILVGHWENRKLREIGLLSI